MNDIDLAALKTAAASQQVFGSATLLALVEYVEKLEARNAHLERLTAQIVGDETAHQERTGGDPAVMESRAALMARVGRLTLALESIRAYAYTPNQGAYFEKLIRKALTPPACPSCGGDPSAFCCEARR